MIKILWTEPAVSDLENIQSYISKDSEHYANAVLLEIFTAIDQLASFPKIGRIIPKYDEITREIIVKNYRIIYDIVNDHIRILAIVHTAKLFPNHI